MPTKAIRTGAFLVVGAILFIGACSDNPVAPPDGLGRYRLVTVDGTPVPLQFAPSYGLGTITHGDLLLRSDGTFVLGVGASDVYSAMFIDQGSFERSGRDLQLVAPPGPARDSVSFTAHIAGDSIVVQVPSPQPGWIVQPTEPPASRYVFRRSAVNPAPITEGGFRLTSVNGRADLVLADTIIGRHRFVRRVRYDSLAFAEGMFYRRHRAEQHGLLVVDGDSLYGGYDWSTPGSYVATGDTIVLRPYYSFRAVPFPDTLYLTGAILVRRTPSPFGSIEEIEEIEEHYEPYR